MSKILIIDDERDLVALLAKKLRTNGHEVFTAYDGRAGAELAQRELPDLILLDIMMPEMDGFDVCRAIRDEVLCPILFLSARQAESDKIRGCISARLRSICGRGVCRWGMCSWR